MIAAGLVGVALVAAACGSKSSNADKTTTTSGAATSAGSQGSTNSSGPATTTAPTTAAAAKPTMGGNLRVGVEADTNGWIPAAMQCDSACQMRARTFFEPLAALDPDGNVKPYLADSIDHNADYTKWTVKLKPGITFHDGSPLDAAAAVKSLQRAFVTGFVSLAYLNVQGAGPGKPPEGVAVKAVDPMTIEIDMVKPWVTFPYFLTGQGAFMASPKWLDKVYADPTKPDNVTGAQPVGTGPFVFDSWKPGDTLTVKKNPNYWRKDGDGNPVPYLDGITFRVIADGVTREKALESGDLDLIQNDTGESIKKMRDLAKSGKLNLSEQSKNGETFYILEHVGQDGSPLQDQRVRCGLAAATDSKTLAETTGAGVFPVANGPFSPGQDGYMDNPGNQTYDPAKAKDLISQYTKEKGKPKITYSTTTDSTALQSAQLIQQWWQDAGVDVNVQQVEQQKLILNALLGDKGFNAFGWRNHAGYNVDNQYFWWHSSAALPDGQPALNFGRMKDPVIDQALDANRAEPDPAKAKQYAQQINQEFAKQCWIIPTSWTIWGIGSQTSVQGVGQNTFPDNKTLLLDGAGFPGQVWLQQVSLKK